MISVTNNHRVFELLVDLNIDANNLNSYLKNNENIESKNRHYYVIGIRTSFIPDFSVNSSKKEPFSIVKRIKLKSSLEMLKKN